MGPLEIERVFLLSGMPTICAAHEVLKIEQGYLHGADGASEGRLRRTTRSDGSVKHHFTIKRGTGLVREEIEREIDASEFELRWPESQARRIRKHRHKVREGDLVWEIDEFLDFPLVLAEVELPNEAHPVEVPSWLKGCIVREVTFDPQYRNYSLASVGPPGN